MALAEQQIASWSKDGSTKVGAIIANGKKFISLGFNGPASGVDDSMIDLGREVKLAITLHAELNAILEARRDLTGCTIYVWPMPPCAQCAAAIIQVGITRVVSCGPTEAQHERWGRDFALAERMYRDAGVTLDILDPSPCLEVAHHGGSGDRARAGAGNCRYPRADT